jgi:diaminopimelate epimerase
MQSSFFAITLAAMSRIGYARRMRIEFLKMQGLGNDFLVFDAAAVASHAHLDEGTLRALADRHTGIGFDQALMLESPKGPGSRVFYRVFNSDGTEVEQCGNGARCVAALLYSRAPELGRELIMDSTGGTVRARVREDGMVSVEMHVPKLDEPLQRTLHVQGKDVEVNTLAVGNPHAVLRVADVKTAPVEELGPAIEHHPHFPNRINVGFMQIIARNHLALRVFERGAGETRACGTGACAAVAVGVQRGWLDAEVRVDLPGGAALVSWAGLGKPIWLTGPASFVYTGSIDLTRFTGAKQ